MLTALSALFSPGTGPATCCASSVTRGSRPGCMYEEENDVQSERNRHGGEFRLRPATGRYVNLLSARAYTAGWCPCRRNRWYGAVPWNG